jgi:hypothetical protein
VVSANMLETLKVHIDLENNGNKRKRGNQRNLQVSRYNTRSTMALQGQENNGNKRMRGKQQNLQARQKKTLETR